MYASEKTLLLLTLFPILFDHVVTQVLVTTTSTGAGIKREDQISWSFDTLSVIIEVVTEPVTVSIDAELAITYTTTSSVKLIDCVLDVTGSSCSKRVPTCTTTGYSVACTHTSTNAQITVTITIDVVTYAQDNNSVLEFPTAGGDITSWSYNPETVLVLECSTSEFTGASTTDGACGYNCEKTFSCASGFVGEPFVRTCSAIGQWNNRTSACTQACDNAFFGPLATADQPADVAGEGGTKNFTCNVPACTNPPRFIRTCGSNGGWTNESNPCKPECDASIVVTCSPKEAGPFCPGDHVFSCPSDSCKTEDTLECKSDGQWNSTVCDCPKACDQLFKDPHAWALGLGVTWGLAFLIFIARLIMKYGGCSCRSKCCGGCCSCSMECCTPKDDNGCCNCYIRVLKPAEWVAGWCCCCKIQDQTRWWIGLGVYWFTCSVIPYVISLPLLLKSVTECCSGNSTMIPGIIFGFIAIPLQIFFTVASFSKPTYHRANSWKSKDKSGPDNVDHAGGHDSPSVGTKLVKRGSNGNDKSQVGSSSREEGVIKSTNLSAASDGNRG